MCIKRSSVGLNSMTGTVMDMFSMMLERSEAVIRLNDCVRSKQAMASMVCVCECVWNYSDVKKC